MDEKEDRKFRRGRGTRWQGNVEIQTIEVGLNELLLWQGMLNDVELYLTPSGK